MGEEFFSRKSRDSLIKKNEKESHWDLQFCKVFDQTQMFNTVDNDVYLSKWL